MMAASGKLWLQNRKIICQTRHEFLRAYARSQGLKVSISLDELSLDELFEFIEDPSLRDELTKLFEETLDEVTRPFFEALEEDEPRPHLAFISPAVTVRRTSPNAHRGVGHGSNGTGNKDPSDPDGDGGGDGDGDSNSLCRCLTRSPIFVASDGHNKNARASDTRATPLEEVIYHARRL